MENAAKALVIAGAILISILLISVGIMVMNSTGDVQGQMESQMTAAAMQSFNSQFSAYVGSGRTAAQVRSLQQVVAASNAANELTQVTIKWGTIPTGFANTVKNATANSNVTATQIAQMTSKNRFTIANEDTDGNGYFDKITITPES